ncbi:hypothetical protein G6F60_014108 [Rhizopus arrhizus]|nr:hypothetical protein G6F60_014108 [Rhizopus arrhizus]
MSPPATAVRRRDVRPAPAPRAARAAPAAKVVAPAATGPTAPAGRWPHQAAQHGPGQHGRHHGHGEGQHRSARGAGAELRPRHRQVEHRHGQPAAHDDAGPRRTRRQQGHALGQGQQQQQHRTAA